ncbi:MAG: glycosyltransferase [Acidobacteria bacterium]|nr:glycosyltransferase [Acidobacteriota bacterium]
MIELNELGAWQPQQKAFTALFAPAELSVVEDARRSVRADRRHIAYCVYENPFARAGGIFAVASHLPKALRAAGESVTVLSPFHRNLSTTPPYYSLHYLGEVDVPFGGRDVRVELFEHFDRFENRWVLMQAWGFFDADGGPDGSNPYAHVHSWQLLRDSLFACAAVPYVLARLGLRSDLVVHAQDWQMASTALTVKQAALGGHLDSAAVVLTSHNPYDHPLPAPNLSWITNRLGPERWPFGSDTVYQRMVPVTDAPLSTVSPGFAAELTTDPLQANHFAAHLQGVYKAHQVVGIDNPLFGEPTPPFSSDGVRAARVGSTDVILEEKLAKRRQLLQILSEYKDPRILGGLDAGAGAPLTELPEEVPVFLMFGRLDPGQKGFDVFARAIEGFDQGEAKFILTPIAGGGGPYLDDLRLLAEKRKGDVAVFPFRMERGYLEAMAGATYAVMPSLYEPFGAATEAYLAGTPVVARSTGGLMGQVADFASGPADATGFLLREKLPLGASWPGIINAGGPGHRTGIPLYVMIAEALFDRLQEAARLWRADRRAYARLLGNLFDKAASFSGERSAAGYQALYDAACDPSPRF